MGLNINLFNQEKQLRLEFAHRYINSNFHNIVFADEAAYQTWRYGLYHMRKASCRPKASWFNPQYVQRLNVCGEISWNGPSKFPFTTNLDSKGYSIIIKKYIKNFIDNYPGECILFQDNDSKHSSCTCVRTLEENNMTWIKIPANSPDINIIEDVWGDMRRFVQKNYCETLKDLRKRVTKYVQNKFKVESFRNHINKLHDLI
ncbi:unnamed protein product [Brachionus calyciflorus]|uniref:Tc1-like transposase DDE domain-containing protein n=1 Tax=Brachionus calyciflorus TaxID=104777 RepID=A0A814HK00_9BILA|nr:unnamed protein product [Brachionus calyciflorus]